MAKENKIRIVKMKVWQWLNPIGIERHWRDIINIDEQDMINTTFSDGAHGEGGYQRFCYASVAAKPSRLRFYLGFGAIDFTSSFLAAYLSTCRIFLPCSNSTYIALDTKAMLGGYVYQNLLTQQRWYRSTGLLDQMPS